MRLGCDEVLGALLREALLAEFLGLLAVLVLLALDDGARLLREDQLDVARRRHVRVGAAVRTIRAPALLLRPVDLDVGDLEALGVKALDL